MGKTIASPGDLTMAKLKRGTNQKLKVLASLEAMTVPEYLELLVDKAYEATQINRGRKVSV